MPVSTRLDATMSVDTGLLLTPQLVSSSQRSESLIAS